MLKTLYDIQAEHASLIQWLLDLEGELTPELELQLLISEEELEAKAEGYALRVLEFNGMAALIDNEIIRLEAKKQQYTKTSDKLKERIKEAMIQFKKDKIKTTRVSLSFRKSEAVEIPESFTDSVLKVIKLKAEIAEEKVEALLQAASDAGATPPQIPDESILEYFKLSAAVDKAKVKSDLKEGLTISDCTIITKQNLQIK